MANIVIVHLVHLAPYVCSVHSTRRDLITLGVSSGMYKVEGSSGHSVLHCISHPFPEKPAFSQSTSFSFDTQEGSRFATLSSH